MPTPVIKGWNIPPGRIVLTIPEAARILGLGRNSAYEAAARGEIPTIRIGRLLRVPVRALERMLDDASAPGARPAGAPNASA